MRFKFTRQVNKGSGVVCRLLSCVWLLRHRKRTVAHQQHSNDTSAEGKRGKQVDLWGGGGGTIYIYIYMYIYIYDIYIYDICEIVGNFFLLVVGFGPLRFSSFRSPASWFGALLFRGFRV